MVKISNFLQAEVITQKLYILTPKGPSKHTHLEMFSVIKFQTTVFTSEQMNKNRAHCRNFGVLPKSHMLRKIY